MRSHPYLGKLLFGVFADENCVRRALAGCCTSQILQFRRHLAAKHYSVPVFVHCKQFGTDADAYSEACAYFPVDVNFHALTT